MIGTVDSLSQMVLGAAVCAAIVPGRWRRRALVAGAVLGTLPDLDVVPLSALRADVMTRVTWHRGPSHSLFVLAVAGWLLWLAARRWWPPVREAPVRWLVAIEGQPDKLTLARDPETMELRALADLERGDWVPPHVDPRVKAVLVEVTSKRPEQWGDRTLADLLGSAAPARPREVPERRRAP